MASAWARFKARAVRALATVGAAGLGAAAVGAAVARRRLEAATSLPPEGFVLELDLEGTQVVEVARPRGLQALAAGAPQLPLHQAADALRAAGGDARVKGLLVLLGGGPGMGLAQVQELRDALADFRQNAAGRAPAVAFADSFGEGGAGGTGAYYLAAACDVVAMPPSGLLSCTGLAAATPYARGLLDRWRVTPLFFAREDYKTAANFLRNRASTGPEREQLADRLRRLSTQIVRGIAAGRGLTEDQVRAAIDAAPHAAGEAAALGLVDAPLFRDQASKLVARLHEALAPARPRNESIAAAQAAARAALTALATGQPAEAVAAAFRQQLGACVPGELLARLLAAPDEEPASRLTHVPIARYAAAVERERERREAEQRWLRRLGAAREALGPLAARLGEARAWVREAALGAGGGADGGAAQPAADAPESPATAGELAAPAPAAAAARQAQPAPAGELPVVALLTLAGPITLGPPPPRASPLGGGSDGVASLPVVKALRAAREDAATRAVVLRIDSPGGSAAASEAIHREVALTVAAGKPVVVSMGNVAASGGYYVAAGASRIVAQPGTLTGSIGVLAGKLVIDEALRQYGVEVEVASEGRNALAMSPLTRLTRSQRRQVEERMDATYALFKRRVAEGRGLKPEAVARVARGRVWTGEQALGLGLVDALGGLHAAVEAAKREAGLPAEPGAVRLAQVWPEPRDPLRALLALLRGDDGSQPAAPAPAGTALAAATAAALGRPVSGAELELLGQLAAAQAAGGGLAPQCISLEAARLAAAL